MSSYLSEVCYSANQDFLLMSFIKTEKTQDTLWVKIRLKWGKRGNFFRAGSRKTFELAAKGIFVNMKSLNPAGNFLFHKYFSGHWPSMLYMDLWACLKCAIRQFFKEILKNGTISLILQFNLAIKDIPEVTHEAKKALAGQLPAVGRSMCVEISLKTSEVRTESKQKPFFCLWASLPESSVSYQSSCPLIQDNMRISKCY